MGVWKTGAGSDLGNTPSKHPVKTPRHNPMSSLFNVRGNILTHHTLVAVPFSKHLRSIPHFIALPSHFTSSSEIVFPETCFAILGRITGSPHTKRESTNARLVWYHIVFLVAPFCPLSGLPTVSPYIFSLSLCSPPPPREQRVLATGRLLETYLLMGLPGFAPKQHQSFSNFGRLCMRVCPSVACVTSYVQR